VTSGTVIFNERCDPPAAEERARLGLARTFQVPLTFESMSVLDNATIGALLRHPHVREARAKAATCCSASASGPSRNTGENLGTPDASGWKSPRACLRAQGAVARRAMAGLTRPEVRDAIELVRRIHGAASPSSLSSTSWR